MKKRIWLPLILIAALSLFCACEKKDPDEHEKDPDNGGGEKKQAVLDRTDLTLAIGETAEITLRWETVAASTSAAPDSMPDSADQDGQTAEYIWTSADEQIATVSADGLTAEVTAVAVGNTTVSVRQGEETLATCTVTVTASPLSVTVPEGILVLRKNAAATVRAKIAPELAGEFTWESSDTAIGVVEYQGPIAVVKAKERGNCTITVRCGVYSAEFVLSVGLSDD